jgi:hypothetical protein
MTSSKKESGKACITPEAFEKFMKEHPTKVTDKQVDDFIAATGGWPIKRQGTDQREMTREEIREFLAGVVDEKMRHMLAEMRK